MIARLLHTFGKSREGRKQTASYTALRRGIRVGAGSALEAVNGFFSWLDDPDFGEGS